MHIINSEYKPLPTREQRYPFHQLEVGQSFDFKLYEVSFVRGGAYQASKKTGKKFTVRKIKDEGCGRCFRIA